MEEWLLILLALGGGGFAAVGGGGFAAVGGGGFAEPNGETRPTVIVEP